jgi:enoyl-CoA hydratase/carnithine racemase
VTKATTGGAGAPTGELALVSPLGDDMWQLTLNQPTRRNALSSGLAQAFQTGVERCLTEGAKAIVLTAEGPVFCSGADLADPDRAQASRIVVETITASQVPWLTCVAGPVIGAGLGLLARSAVVVMSDNAWISLPETKATGNFPAPVGEWVVPTMAPRQFVRLALGGERQPASAVVSLGLASEVVAADKLDTRRQEWVEVLKALDRAVLRDAQRSWRSWSACEVAQRDRGDYA